MNHAKGECLCVCASIMYIGDLFSNVGYDWCQLREGLHASTTHVGCGYSSDYVCALQSRSLAINAWSAHLTADTAVSTRFAGNLLRSWFLLYCFGSWIAKLAFTRHLEQSMNMIYWQTGVSISTTIISSAFTSQIRGGTQK